VKWGMVVTPFPFSLLAEDNECKAATYLASKDGRGQ